MIRRTTTINQRPANQRPPLKEVRKTARSLEKSLQSAHQGLSLLLKSLQQSGFAEAIHGYQQLQMVLIQQRLWACNHHREELNRYWHQIAKTTTEIHDILAPLSAIMAELKAIDTINAVSPSASLSKDSSPNLPESEAVEPTQAVPPPPVDAKMADLAAALLPTLAVSQHYITKATQNNASLHLADLKSLVDARFLEPHGWGNSKSYRVVPQLQERLLADLANLLKPSQSTEP